MSERGDGEEWRALMGWKFAAAKLAVIGIDAMQKAERDKVPVGDLWLHAASAVERAVIERESMGGVSLSAFQRMFDRERASWATERAALVAEIADGGEKYGPDWKSWRSRYLALLDRMTLIDRRERASWAAELEALVAAGYDLWDWVEAAAEDNYWRGEDEEAVGRALDQWRALAADSQTANEDAEAP